MFRLITIDWIGGAFAGTLVLVLGDWLTRLYALPPALLRTIGVANLAYACVSFSLVMRNRGGVAPFMRVMATANMIWALCCVAFAVVWFGEASVFRMVRLVGEGIFVGGLGVLEWRAAAALRLSSAERSTTAT